MRTVALLNYNFNRLWPHEKQKSKSEFEVIYVRAAWLQPRMSALKHEIKKERKKDTKSSVWVLIKQEFCFSKAFTGLPAQKSIIMVLSSGKNLGPQLLETQPWWLVTVISSEKNLDPQLVQTANYEEFVGTAVREKLSSCRCC